MGRGGRLRSKRANQWATGSTASHRNPQALQNNNTYASLEALEYEGKSCLASCFAAATPAPHTSYGELSPSLLLKTKMNNAKIKLDQEVNADLTERFRGMPSSFSEPNYIPHNDIPRSGRPRPNNDIREYFELAKLQVAGGSWLDKPEIPSPWEILRPESDIKNGNEALIEVDETIRPHKPEGAYKDEEEYLGTKYDILREDAVRSLRDIIGEVRAEPFKDEAEYSDQSIGIYDPVYITSLVFSPRGLATRVAFSLNRVKKHIR